MKTQNIKKTITKHAVSALLVLTLGGSASAATLSVTALGDPDQAIDLTALGTGDWALYTTTDLEPTESKAGGSGINAVTYTGSDVLGASNSSQSILYSWSDGSPTASNPGATFDADHLSTVNEPDSAVFSTSVLASTTLNTLYVTYGQWNAVSRITVSLSDGSIADQQLDLSTNDHQTVQIDFASDTDAVLNVEIEFLSDEGNTNSQLRFQSLALANAVDPIPEPSTTALLGLGGLALILRRRK